ncbi:tetratricopeptide repeat protein [Jeongeupia chitinilytica]|uniref:Tetratricopeptide repeat protein n=1 Tax=Jeongeupia chitinilytica TaxID=1041641 RepID=A0ABQ3H0C6_9NEIS|nr:hypothetical protein [Jeongeupia chitinilytica]GHD60153.1 hypothetical protein GCM10007350_12660 [Jeongeupia chitinilytica]
MIRAAVSTLLLGSLVILSACGGAPTQPGPVLAQKADAAALAANRAAQVGNDEEAADLWQSALDLRRAIDDWTGVGEARLGLAQVLVRLQRPADAARALAEMPADGLYPAGQRARAAYQLAVIAVADVPTARRWLVQAQALCVSPCAIAVPLRNLDARLALAEGDPAAALVRADASADASPVERAHAERIRAEALGALGRNAEALSALQAAIVLDRQLAEPAYLADDFSLLRRLALAAGDEGLSAQAARRLDGICAVAAVPACRSH